MTAKQKANRERFKKVVAEAKKLRKKNPKLTQAQAVKQAWAIMYSKKRAKVGAAKSKYKYEVYNGGDQLMESFEEKDRAISLMYYLIKNGFEEPYYVKYKGKIIKEQKIGAAKKSANKKASPKKSSRYHKDTKSHNVNIRVISGIDDQMSAIRNNLEKSIDYYMKRIAMIQNAYGRLSASEKLQAKKIIKRYKTTITKLLKQLRETNQLIAKNVK